MRSFLLIALTTALACENTVEETTQTNEDTSAESASEDQGEALGMKQMDDLAGGMPDMMDGIVFFENFESHDSETDDWGAAPMLSGVYEATIDEIESKECSPLKPGDEFDGQLIVDEDGNSVLNGGLLESNGDHLRYTRTKDAPYMRTDDCFAVEITKGKGMIDSSMVMTMDFEITMSLEGSDCPIVEPCVDAYSATFEHHMIDLETPSGPTDEVTLDPILGNLPLQ